MSDESHGHVKQEEDKIQTRRIVTIGLIAFLSFAVGIWWAVNVQRDMTGTIKSNTAPDPALAGHTEIGMVYQPVFDRGRGIAAERNAPAVKRLGEYGWENAEHTIAHIPIDRAMELIVERGKL
jgi:hypothetical protein